jgi:hypothetical protein
MSRSRAVLFVSMTVVLLGVMVGLGALWLDSARAAVGPLPAEGLVLPADTRFVVGFDVKRLVASPLWSRWESRRAAHPETLRMLEEATGLDPARDVDQIVFAGTSPSSGLRPLVLALGRFDPAKIGSTVEARGRAEVRKRGGATLYSWSPAAGSSSAAHARRGPYALGVLGRGALVLGPADRVEAFLDDRAQGKTPLRQNASLLGLLETVRPGAAFWGAGDESLLAGLPKEIPAPGASGASASLNLPPLRGVTFTGDLDPEVSISLTGVAADATSAGQLADVVRGIVAFASLQAQQKPELKQLASAISVATEANRVLVSARVPYELLDALRPKPASPPADKPDEPGVGGGGASASPPQ